MPSVPLPCSSCDDLAERGPLAFQRDLWPLSQRRRVLTPWVLVVATVDRPRCPGHEAGRGFSAAVRLAKATKQKAGGSCPGGQAGAAHTRRGPVTS